MSGHVWYSFGSDITGPKLAEALGFTHSKKKPDFSNIDVLVCWGCKPGEKYDPKILKRKIEAREIRVLNFPGAIGNNRNKLAALIKLRGEGVTVPGFLPLAGTSTANTAILVADKRDRGELAYPLIGYNELHKGKPVFCQTEEDVLAALKVNSSRKEGAIKIHYLRSFCPGTEYRLHTFRDVLICAEKKVLSKNPVKSITTSLKQGLEKRSKKQEVQLSATENEISWIVENLTQDLLRGPSHLQRSVGHGWEWTAVDPREVPTPAITEAVAALEALSLDMGAVGVVVEAERATVTSVTSAPGINDAQVTHYVDAIKEFTEAAGEPNLRKVAPENSRTAPAKKKEGGKPASSEIIATITRKLRSGKLSSKRAEEILKELEE